MYYMGEGCEKNVKKALEAYQLSAEQGNSSAQFNLGINNLFLSFLFL